MESKIIKIFLIAVILLFIVGIIIPMMCLRRKGKNPHGSHEGYSILARLSSICIFLWLGYVLIFIIWDESIMNILVINFLIIDGFIILGMILICLGFLTEAIGILNLGINFRIELPKEETELITSGIYRVMRNPIVLGLFLVVIGGFFIIPTLISLIFLIMNLITFNSKVKDEEKFLNKRFGESFVNYKNQVGRYFPIIISKKK